MYPSRLVLLRYARNNLQNKRKGLKMNQKNDTKLKRYMSQNYNYIFDTETGFFARWGSTLKDDPDYAPFPEILDIEITTKCMGPGEKLCPFCYKGNTPNGTNMSFDTFKQILDRMPSILQIAFGADAQCKSNPDIWKMMEYCRSKNVVPNITIADIDDETADNLLKYVGACAVSRYSNKDICYDSIKKLTDRGLKQTNMHFMISKETYNQAIETIHDCVNDPRLDKLNAIVFLSLKTKGRGTGFTPLTQEEFNTLMDECIKHKVPFGMDSCSAHKYLNYIKDKPELKNTEFSVEPCESSCFSSYISVDGEFFPCSFLENIGDFKEGINVLEYKSFNEIWNHEKVKKFREILLKNERRCPVYNI